MIYEMVAYFLLNKPSMLTMLITFFTLIYHQYIHLYFDRSKDLSLEKNSELSDSKPSLEVDCREKVKENQRMNSNEVISSDDFIMDKEYLPYDFIYSMNEVIYSTSVYINLILLYIFVLLILRMLVTKWMNHYRNKYVLYVPKVLLPYVIKISNLYKWLEDKYVYSTLVYLFFINVAILIMKWISHLFKY